MSHTPEQTSDESGESSEDMNYVNKLFAALGIAPKEVPNKLLNDLSINGIKDYIQSEHCKNIIVMCGAGISTSAGIPDFRSPNTGLYDNLGKFDLPNPQAIFHIGYFKYNPKPFFTLAKEIYPGQFKPTPTHYFIKLLEEKNLLKRLYTQNIDTLEHIAEISADKIVEAHGTFKTSHCLRCKKEYSQNWMKDKIFADEIPHCIKCEDSLVKPDIVFFGEQLPDRFHDLKDEDFEDCDLLIIMGTSLLVNPFANLGASVSKETPRLLINREKCGENLENYQHPFGGLDFDSENAYRDVALLGDCDAQCKRLASLLGWEEELEDLIKTKHLEIDSKQSLNSDTESL